MVWPDQCPGSAPLRRRLPRSFGRGGLTTAHGVARAAVPGWPMDSCARWDAASMGAAACRRWIACLSAALAVGHAAAAVNAALFDAAHGALLALTLSRGLHRSGHWGALAHRDPREARGRYLRWVVCSARGAAAP